MNDSNLFSDCFRCKSVECCECNDIAVDSSFTVQKQLLYFVIY